MPKPLDAREQRFKDEYLVDLDPKRAALAAGYSESVAASKAFQWVSNGKVKPHLFAAINEAKAARSERTQIDADWLLKRLAAEAEADLLDLYEDDGSLKAMKDWPLIWRQGLVAGLDTDEIEVAGKKVGRAVKLKQSDRLKRLELIGKHVDVQAFKDKVEHDVSDPLAELMREIDGKTRGIPR